MHAEKNSSSSSSSSSSGSKKNSSWLCITQCEVHLTNQQSPDRKGGMFIETYWNQSSSFRRKIHKSDWLLATYLNVNSSRLYIYTYIIYTRSLRIANKARSHAALQWVTHGRLETLQLRCSMKNQVRMIGNVQLSAIKLLQQENSWTFLQPFATISLEEFLRGEDKVDKK